MRCENNKHASEEDPGVVGDRVSETRKPEAEAETSSSVKEKPGEEDLSSRQKEVKVASFLGDCPCMGFHGADFLPKHAFERCAFAIFSFTCRPSAHGFTAPLFIYINNTRRYNTDYPPICLSVHWLRIKRIHSQKTKYPFAEFRNAYNHHHSSDEDGDDGALAEYPYPLPTQNYYIFGTRIPIEEENKDSFIEFEDSHNHIYGRVYLNAPGDFDVKDRHYFFLEKEEDTGAPPNIVPGSQMLLAHGLTYPIPDQCPVYELHVNLHTKGEDGKPLEVANGGTNVHMIDQHHDACHIDEFLGKNGCVQVCYSIIMSPMFLRFGAKIIPNDDGCCCRVYGSIIAREFNDEGVEMYLFWADRDRPITLDNGERAIPFVRNSLTVKEGVNVTVSVELYDCSDCGGEDFCIAKGETCFAPSFKYETAESSSSSDKGRVLCGIPGIELMVAVVKGDCDDCCYG